MNRKSSKKGKKHKTYRTESKEISDNLQSSSDNEFLDTIKKLKKNRRKDIKDETESNDNADQQFLNEFFAKKKWKIDIRDDKNENFIKSRNIKTTSKEDVIKSEVLLHDKVVTKKKRKKEVNHNDILNKTPIDVGITDNNPKDDGINHKFNIKSFIDSLPDDNFVYIKTEIPEKKKTIEEILEADSDFEKI